MKKILLIIAVLVVVGLVFILFKNKSKTDEIEYETGVVLPSSHMDASYIIEGEAVTLVGGHAEISIPDSGSVTSTDFFGNEARGDLNGDGKEDIAFLVTQDGGGTGIFFYSVVALKTENGYLGTNGIFLGDRIAPQTTEIRNGEIIVNYAERNPDEAYSVRPSVGVSKYLKVSGNNLEVIR